MSKNDIVCGLRLSFAPPLRPRRTSTKQACCNAVTILCMLGTVTAVPSAIDGTRHEVGYSPAKCVMADSAYSVGKENIGQTVCCEDIAAGGCVGCWSESASREGFQQVSCPVQ
jgi:hypothetical protein